MMRIDNCVALFSTATVRYNAKQEVPEPRRTRNTKHVGIVSELVAMERFAAAGFLMCVPFGDCAPYDLILDNRRGRVFRVQVKTGRLRKGVVLFSCCSNHAHRNAPPTQYTGRIEAFAVYCPDNGDFYVVPIDANAVTSSHGSLRIASPANNMRKKIKWANDYKFDETDPEKLLTAAVREE